MGTITRRNMDARRKIDGKILNFYVHYEIDDEEASHVLEVDTYAAGPVSGAPAAAPAASDHWVLLEALQPAGDALS